MAPNTGPRAPQSSKTDAQGLQDACPRLQIGAWPDRQTPGKQTVITYMLCLCHSQPALADIGSQWISQDGPETAIDLQGLKDDRLGPGIGAWPAHLPSSNYGLILKSEKQTMSLCHTIISPDHVIIS